MTDTALLGGWVRRFLLEYLVSERNLARNTQRSYRDTFRLLLPFLARAVRKGDRSALGTRPVGRASAAFPERTGGEARLRRGDEESATGGDAVAGTLHRPAQPRTRRLVRTGPVGSLQEGARGSRSVTWRRRRWMHCWRHRT